MRSSAATSRTRRWRRRPDATVRRTRLDSKSPVCPTAPPTTKIREEPMLRIVAAALMLAAGTVTAFAQGVASPEVLKELAPTGKLRAAINLGNAVLAQKDPATGQPKGVTP